MKLVYSPHRRSIYATLSQLIIVILMTIPCMIVAQNQTCCPAGTILGPEQVVNGDFEMGNTGFNAPCYPYFNPGGLTSIGQYSVLNSNQVNIANSQWFSINHTPPALLTGQMLIVDGANSTCNIAWQEQVFVTKGIPYSFCAFVNNLVIPTKNFDDPIIQLWINNALITTSTFAESPDSWLPIAALWTATLNGFVNIEIRLGSNSSVGNDFAVDDISFRSCEKSDACHCGPFEILYGVGRGPLIKHNCGDTLSVPADVRILPIRLLTSFQCIGNNCPPTALVDWKLTGPPGFTTLMMNQVQATPDFTIPINNSSFYLNGNYTLTMLGYCGKDTCPCKIYFNQPNDCCQNLDVFCNTVNNAVSITVDTKLCKVKLNVGNMNDCDSIVNITWGDGQISSTHLGSNSMMMHNYSNSTTAIISWTAFEYDNSVPPKICFDKIFRDTITLNCNPVNSKNCGWTVATCYSPNATDPVGVIYDTRFNSSAVPGTDWGAALPSASKIHPANWTTSKIGQVFGIALDNVDQIYLAATDVYFYDNFPTNNSVNATTSGGTAGVYKTNINSPGITTAIVTTSNSPTISSISGNKLPNTGGKGNGIGNICYDHTPGQNQLFLSNLEDGRIYRIDPNGNILSAYDPFGIDPGLIGLAPIGERIWAVGYNQIQNRVYFALESTNPLQKNVYSVGLNSSGEFNASNISPGLYGGIPQSEIVGNTPGNITKFTDMAFSQDGTMMLLSERGQAHNAAVFEYKFSGTWIPSGDNFHVGALAPGLSSAGGVDYGYREKNGNPISLCDDIVWATGNYMMANNGPSKLVYGLEGISSSGNLFPGNSTSDIYVDFDGLYSSTPKYQIGDVEVFKCGCQGQPSYCDSIHVSSTPFDDLKDSCCFKFTINNQKPNFFSAIKLCAQNGLSISNVSVLNGWGLNGYSASMVTLVPPGGIPNPIPTGIKDILKFCLSNYQNVFNQEIIVKYYDSKFEIVCMDTLHFNCTAKPKCFKITDTIVCDKDGKYKMNFCIMSNPLIPFNVGSFVLNPPPGITFTPNVFVTSPSIPPGGMQCGFMTSISGAIDGQKICFSVTAHQQNVMSGDSIKNCCTDTVMLSCVTMPSCVCDKVSVSTRSVILEGDTCCWKVNLMNNYSNNYFTGVQLNILTPGVVFGAIDNSLFNWNMISNTTMATLTPIPGPFIGATAILPSFCLSGITSSAQVPQVVVVHWLGPNGIIACTDTLRLECKPPVVSDCAVIVNPNISCDKIVNGLYNFSFQVYNNSGHAINQVNFNSVSPPNLFPTQWSFALLPNGSTSGTLSGQIIGMLPGQTICFYLTVHEIGANGNELNCCTHSTKYCFTLPSCPDSCSCDSTSFNFQYAISKQVLLPYHCGDTLNAPLSSSGLAVNLFSSFHCIGQDCDSIAKVEWTLSGPGIPPFQNIEMTNSSGAFANPISASIFVNPGIYTLMFQGYCGKDTCKCKLYFKVADTCCNCNLFAQQVLSNVNVSVNHTLCKATVNVGNLPCNGYLENINWGDSQQSVGPFYSGVMPMHNYSLPGQYIISYLAIQLNPQTGKICCEKMVRDTFFLDCTIKDTCECAPFSNEQFYNSSWPGVSFNVTCNQTNTILLPCLKQGQNPLFFFRGNQNCNAKNCIKDSIKWNIIEMPLMGSSNSIAGGSTNVNSSNGHFDITLNQSWFNATSSYMLVVTGHCGTKICTCKITFKFRTCPCPCDSVKVDVAKGFKVTGSVPYSSCKRTFMPIDLCPNDVINWTVNGIVAGTTTGNNSLMIAFPGSGWFNVCMIVTRTENGKVCKSEYCRKVKVKCIVNPNITHCTKDSVGNSIRNGDFQGGIQGELGKDGTMPNWTLFPNVGDGYVIVDDSTGASDDGHLILNGDKGNFAGVWQQVYLSGDDYTIIEYARRNYLGENSPSETAIEFRLQSEPTLGSPFQVIYRDLIDIADSSAWVNKAQSPKVKADKQMRYLVVCLQNNSNGFSIIGIDNLEICSSSSVNTNQYQLNKNIRIIPNPNFGTFDVELPTNNEAGIKLRVTSIDGKLLLEQMTKVGSIKNTIHAEDLPTGLYMLQVILENKVIANQKFVKY